ncbi:MAG: magnesium transporter CorA family protein [Rickettsiales bacterium]|nr:magnesium transporter CorA family protein [Rickettsiales bacterium]
MLAKTKLKTFDWLNVYNLDHDDLATLDLEYKIDSDTLADIMDADEQPRIEQEDDYKVIIVRFPVVDKKTDAVWHTEPLSIIYAKGRVITICRKKCEVLDRIPTAAKESREFLILNIIYKIAEQYLKSLKELNKRVLAAKSSLEEKMRKSQLLALLEIENSYTLYAAGIKGNGNVLEKLDKTRSFNKENCDELIDETRIELNQAAATADAYSRMLVATKNTFESVINIDSNTYINRLTMWNIILMVPTFIVGYYGMNTKLPYADEADMTLAWWVLAASVFMAAGYGISIAARRE